MKKLLLTIIASFIISFSFSQNKSLEKDQAKMKFNTVNVVEHFSKALKLDAKQKSIFMKNFSEYANNVTKAQHKAKDKAKAQSDDKVKVNDKKVLNAYVMRFSEKRNQNIEKCLKGKQVKKYYELLKQVHPVTLTLELKKNVKKGRK